MSYLLADENGVFKVESNKEFNIHYVAMACCADAATASYLKEPLMWELAKFDDDTLSAAAMVAESIQHSERNENDASMKIRSLVINEKPVDIKTVANHLVEIEKEEISVSGLLCLVGTLRHLGLMGSEDEHYPYLYAHVKLAEYAQNLRSPYHQSEELVRVVHEHHSQHEEIINLMHVRGIKDVGLLREHLRNKAPALSDGIL